MRIYSSVFLSLCFFLSLSSLTYGQNIAAVGDLNGDGKPDVVVGNGSLNTVSVFLNDGAGNLTGAHFLTVTRAVQSVQLADFSGDGHLDILVTETAPPGVAYDIFLGDGTGAFSNLLSVPLGGLVPTTIPAVGDFNGDGFQDIAFSTGSAGSDIQILFGDGHGGFSAPHATTIALEGASIQRLAITDANHDGKPDLVAGGEKGVSGFVCYLALNDSAGGFTTSPLRDLLSQTAQCRPSPDLNGDGNVDFLTEFTIYFGDGQGGVLYTQPRINSIKVADGISADFDHNGSTDFVQFHVQPEIQYYPGNGHGGFGDPITISPSTFNIIAVADLNGDGFPDLVLQDPLNPANITVSLNPAVTPASIATASQIQISASAATASTAAPVTLIASVSSLNAFAPQAAGTVTFTDGATSLGSAPVNVYGIAALDVTFTAGAHSVLNAAYGGALDASTNTTFAASSSTAAAAVGVNPTTPPGSAPNIALSSSVNPARELNSVTFTATVTPSTTTTFTSSGSVVFRADGDVLGVAALQGSAAQLIVAFPNPGLHNITATYGGDGVFPPATSSTLVEDIRSFNAARNPSSTQLTISPTSLSAPNQAVALKATLAGVANPPSQFVYRVNGAFLAFAPQSAQFPPTFTPAAQGAYTISAEYPGDAVLAPSTASATLVVGSTGGDFSMSSSPQSATIKAGQTATFTVTISPAAGFSSATTFSCSGLPAASSCTFSPSTLTPAGAPLSTTLTVTTTAPQSATVPIAELRRGIFSWSFMASFAFGLLLVGRFSSSAKAGKLARVPVALALLLFIASCGGGGGGTVIQPPNNGTPAGTTQITVTATTSGVTHTLPITLTVQ